MCNWNSKLEPEDGKHWLQWGFVSPLFGREYEALENDIYLTDLVEITLNQGRGPIKNNSDTWLIAKTRAIGLDLVLKWFGFP